MFAPPIAKQRNVATGPMNRFEPARSTLFGLAHGAGPLDRVPTAEASWSFGNVAVFPPTRVSRVAAGSSPRALPGSIRRSMEHSFGMDFSGVRVDERPEAAALGARAFTRGTDIHFAPGQYRLDSVAGRELLGHELTHVAQQARGAARGTKRVGGVIVNDSPPLEREADVLGARAARGQKVGPVRVPSQVAEGTLSKGANAPDGRPSFSLVELSGAAPIAAGVPSLGAVQCAQLLDFADASVAHEPSRLTDAQIQATNEYRSFMNPELVWQRSDHVTAAEALLACRLIVRELRAGGHVGWDSQARQYMVQAHVQLGTVSAEEAMGNQLTWHGQDSANTGTAFGRWLLSRGPEPNPTTGEMNCWEGVMFNAYRQGFTTKARMTTLYTDWVAEAGRSSPAAADAAFENAVRQGREQIYRTGDPDSPRPVAGDLVIFRALGDHVAVATGRYPGGEVEVMSLWTQNSRSVFQTTIERLLTRGATRPVRFFSPRW